MLARRCAFTTSPEQTHEERQVCKEFELTLGDILESLVGSHDCGWCREKMPRSSAARSRLFKVSRGYEEYKGNDVATPHGAAIVKLSTWSSRSSCSRNIRESTESREKWSEYRGDGFP